MNLERGGEACQKPAAFVMSSCRRCKLLEAASKRAARAYLKSLEGPSAWRRKSARGLAESYSSHGLIQKQKQRRKWPATMPAEKKQS